MRQAACVLLYNEYGQVLSVSRKDDPNQPGLPGGKVDPGETAEQAAIRECKEETGLDVTNLKEVFSYVCIGEVDYGTKTFIADYDVNQEIAPVNEKETGVVKWVSWLDLAKGPFGKYNLLLLESESRR